MWEGYSRFTPLFQREGARYGVPVWVLLATAAKESSFNPNADAGRNDGVGLMQMTLATARGLGFAGPRELLFSPPLNVQLGAKLIAQLRGRYPSAPWDHIYSAYRAGSIRLNDAKALIAKDEQYVVGWRRAADFFRVGWRDVPVFPPAGSRPALLPLFSCSYLLDGGSVHSKGRFIVNMQGIPTHSYVTIETDDDARSSDVASGAKRQSWQAELAELGARGYGVCFMVGTEILCSRISGIVPVPGTGIVGGGLS